ncbi:MAG: PDZ domain-containing protein [Coprococcus sp.]|nr:PDZ domain-containing protein [Coprococcus sp.]
MSEEREENQKQGTAEEEEYSFLQETVKDEQATWKRGWSVLWKTAVKGLIFGVAACAAFYIMKPWLDTSLHKENEKVTIPEDEEQDETDQVEETEEPDTELVYPALTLDNYKELLRAVYQVAAESNKCVAEVGAVRAEENWENASFDTANSVSGTIVWENAVEVLVLAPARIARDAQSLSVTFSDGIKYPAALKKQDLNLGLAVFSVETGRLSDTTRNQIQTAVLGNSNIMGRGDPVIVLGKQFGYAGGVGYGIVSSTRNRISVADGEYRIISTDIAAADGGSGVLFNTNGEVIGIVDQKMSSQGSMNLVTAYAISDIKSYIEELSNGKAIPYLGINGVDVTEAVSEEQGIPKGVYVREIEVDSPAMQAGIQNGDVIIEMNKGTVSTISGMNKILMECKVGEQIRIRGKRQGASGYVDMDFDITVGSKE